MSETRASVVTLSNIANGAAVELFDHELKKVMANIKDPNADAKNQAHCSWFAAACQAVRGESQASRRFQKSPCEFAGFPV